MARRRKPAKREIENYAHVDKQRVNNPPVGLVTPATDQGSGKQTYAYDPHLDPQLTWAGKAEHTSFDVPTVSLHVHERIDPRSIVEAVRRRNGESWAQDSLFAAPEENPPLRQAIEFYRHRHNWTNRLVAGDSLLVMNSLLEKEGLGGQVQMVYIDPPYGIRYGSNFQPFVNKRTVTDGRDDDLTQEPETIRAFRDTWELGIHSYLSYLRDRLLLARELLTESGSVFVQISDENVHHVRELMDEVFGNANFVSLILYRRGGFQTSDNIPSTFDFIIWYAKEKDLVKFRHQFIQSSVEEWYRGQNKWIELPSGEIRSYNENTDVANDARVYSHRATYSASVGADSRFAVEFDGESFLPPQGRGWSTNREGFQRLNAANRLLRIGRSLRFKVFHSDFPLRILTNGWTDTVTSGFGESKLYVVQTSTQVIQRCLLMTTDPGDLVFDPTCGSGTAALVAEQWGRRWITCDTSRVALTLAKQRLMTSLYDYYELAHPNEGVGSGFNYKTVPHVTLRSIANNPDIVEGMTRAEIDAAIARHAPQETLYDQPLVDLGKKRVAGPFTVEAVPAPVVRPLDQLSVSSSQFQEPDDTTENSKPETTDYFALTTARQGETLRQDDWRDELLKTGIRGKAGQRIAFSRLEPLPGARWLHAAGDTRPDASGADAFRETPTAYTPERVVVSFGPDHAPLEQLQVEHAWAEARTLAPPPKLLVFAAFQFDPEAAKDIDELDPKLAGMQFLKAQMNADLLTEDLKRQRASNESFWLIGQPDVELHQIRKGQNTGMWQVEVRGFDYFNTRSGGVESGGEERIAMWMLDPDYDGRSLFSRQVFFPMAGPRDGWDRLARNLKAEIDQDLIEAYRGTVSLPFERGEHNRVAVKIIDDRGIESLKVIDIARLDTTPGQRTSNAVS